jgi:hypothetical protein
MSNINLLDFTIIIKGEKGNFFQNYYKKNKKINNNNNNNYK